MPTSRLRLNTNTTILLITSILQNLQYTFLHDFYTKSYTFLHEFRPKPYTFLHDFCKAENNIVIINNLAKAQTHSEQYYEV